jgi:membrane protease YdiL (CAAX protease family)
VLAPEFKNKWYDCSPCRIGRWLRHTFRFARFFIPISLKRPDTLTKCKKHLQLDLRAGLPLPFYSVYRAWSSRSCFIGWARISRHGGTSWWRIFHFLLILPLTCMFVAALIGAAVDQRSISWKGIKQRLRLSAPSATAWLWAAALSGFMYGGNWADLLAVAASWLALWKEKTGQKWMFGAILIGMLVKRYASVFQPTLESIRFFDPSAFHREFFNHFGPKDFMGIPLQGAWWILIYYAVLILVCNIGGEELWWRGYVLPRQELAFGRAAWVVHGISWSIFHLFMQPTLWDTIRMAITGVALSFVAQRTRSTWPGIVGHSFGNLTFFLSLVGGVTSH